MDELSALTLELAQEAYITSQGKRIAAVAVWYIPGDGYLACLLDDNMDQVPGSVVWDYHETLAGAVAEVRVIARRMANKEG